MHLSLSPVIILQIIQYYIFRIDNDLISIQDNILFIYT